MNILIDSNLYKKDDFGLSFDFMLSHGLIQPKEYLISYKVVFVGEVITPFACFISLPKNFKSTDYSNVELVKSILKEFKNLKKRGKTLIKNKSYDFGSEIDSDFFYWRKLYSTFIDYITYEFFYPKKRKVKHSLIREFGRLNPMLTEMNRDKLGNGLTFEIKDHSDNYFRNVYYTILKILEGEFASEFESNKIHEVEVFLKNKNIKFKIIEIDKVVFFKYAKHNQFSDIYQTILKTIINYLLNSKIREKNTINVFYTQEFEYLFEYLLQNALHHNNSLKSYNWTDPNFKTLHPDIITETFIGDAKYYKISDFSQSPFEKELYAYNVANCNSQPNFVFIPSEETKHLKTLIHNSYKLEVLSVNLKEVLTDYYSKKNITLDFVRNYL